MTPRRIHGAIAFFALALLIGASWKFSHHSSAEVGDGTSQDIARSIVEKKIADREGQISQEGSSYEGAHEIHILTLGIDSRKEGNEKHCDAIHVVTLNTDNWTMNILSVPRGTYAALPAGGSYKTTDYYLANACAFGGLEYGIEQITRVTNITPDYIATVGFSEALGIFRVLNLPTTETLQWLRHRQSYAVGDPQRSQNQATFMKDVALQLFQNPDVSRPLIYMLYQFIETDFSFSDIYALYQGYVASGIADHPERITFSMKPFYKTQEYHLDPGRAQEQIQELLSRLEGRLSEQDLSHATLQEVQDALVGYLHDTLTSGSSEDILRGFDDAMWNQVEDDELRYALQFDYLEAYIGLTRESDPIAAQDAVVSFIMEMQFFEQATYEERGKELLETLIREEGTGAQSTEPIQEAPMQKVGE